MNWVSIIQGKIAIMRRMKQVRAHMGAGTEKLCQQSQDGAGIQACETGTPDISGAF